jgi:ABC-type sugar transport system permease subunit
VSRSPTERCGRTDRSFCWLGDFTRALPALGLAGTWVAFGLYMVMFASSMQAMPQELYDAVRVDGAGPVREFFTITCRTSADRCRWCWR